MGTVEQCFLAALALAMLVVLASHFLGWNISPESWAAIHRP